MRIIGVVANLAQMAIILMIFLLNGLALGGWIILALFLLLMIAFFNLLSLLFHSAFDQKGPEKTLKDKETIVKRQDLRVNYMDGPYPTFTIGKRQFRVSDLSENGMRIRIEREEPLKKRMKGQLALLSKSSTAVKVTLIRREGEEAALVFKEPVDYAKLLKEKQILASNQS